MATVITRRRMSASWMIGFSVSTGNVVIASIRDLTSSSTSRVSASVSSSMTTVPEPSAAVDRIVSTPSRS